MSLACMGLAVAAQANTITWNFQENGTGNLGSTTSTFTESGYSLTATGYGGGNLWVKNSGGDENGLGLQNTQDHEITGNTMIQLTLPTAPPSNLQLVIIGSVQSGEKASVYWSPTAGSLLGSTLIGSLTGVDGSVNVAGYNTGFISIVGGGSGGANVLLDSVSAIVNVPDGGTTVALLGGALTALGFIRRKMVA